MSVTKLPETKPSTGLKAVSLNCHRVQDQLALKFFTHNSTIPDLHHCASTTSTYSGGGRSVEYNWTFLSARRIALIPRAHTRASQTLQFSS